MEYVSSSSDTDRLSQRRAMLAGLGGLAAGAMLARGARAGELDPPAGPVLPTMKTLDEVEPRTPIHPEDAPLTITSRGSYYLTGDMIAVTLAQNAVSIGADDVTLDLNGFTITSSEAGQWTNGVRIFQGVSNVTVRNGTVRNSAGAGVNASSTTNCRFLDLRLISNGAGLTAGAGALVERCVMQSNTLHGVSASLRATVRDTVIRENGETGITCNDGGLVIGCLASDNGENGISVGAHSIVSDCTASGNGGAGVRAGTAVTVSRCVANVNSGNGVESPANGSGQLIERCSLTFNGGHGVLAVTRTHIRDNNCNGNGNFGGDAAGIFVSGADNRIEGNNCCINDRGVHATSSGNFIARNICSGNGTLNWDIAANNKCLVVSGVNSGAISGNSGGVSPGSTDPNANYTY